MSSGSRCYGAGDASLKAVVTSSNRAKILGALKALRVLGVKEVVSIPVSPGIEQPLSLKQTLLAAIKRIDEAITRVNNVDYYVSIEGGIILDLAYPVEGQVAVVVDRSRKASIGFSSLFPLPIMFKEMLTRGFTLEDVMYALTGIREIGRKDGAIGYLTHGLITRIELSYQAVLMAILPFLNKSFYKNIPDIGYLKKILKTEIDTQ